MSSYGHPLLDQIEQRRRRLLQMRSPARVIGGSAETTAPALVPSWRPDEVAMLMRGEVDMRAAHGLLDAIARDANFDRQQLTDVLHEGPVTWHGIAIYMVTRLREPGWRLVGLVP